DRHELYLVGVPLALELAPTDARLHGRRARRRAVVLAGEPGFVRESEDQTDAPRRLAAADRADGDGARLERHRAAAAGGARATRRAAAGDEEPAGAARVDGDAAHGVLLHLVAELRVGEDAVEARQQSARLLLGEIELRDQRARLFAD